MGQRSQIYVRYNGKLIIANYYQWNYAERMISRARYGLQYIQFSAEKGYYFKFEDENEIEKLRRIFDVNFDMKDYAMSMNIFEDYADYKGLTSLGSKQVEFLDYCFNMDNNDGKLLIDVKLSKGDKGFSIKNEPVYSVKYAFLDSDNEKNMSASEYIKWDTEDCIPEARDDAINDSNVNIAFINELADRMTDEEVYDFLHNTSYDIRERN